MEPNPSPGLFMSLQCELASTLSRRFGNPRALHTADEVVEFGTIVGQWMQRLPPHLALSDVGTLDDLPKWSQMQQLTTAAMGLSALLGPIRPCLIRPMSRTSPAAELGIRREGVVNSLTCVDKLFKMLRLTFPRDMKYHTVAFRIFDVSSLLCSAMIYDQDLSLPMREPCMAAVQSSLAALAKLSFFSSIARSAHRALAHIFTKMPSQTSSQSGPRRKRPRMQSPQIPLHPNARGDDLYYGGYDFSFQISGMENFPREDSEEGGSPVDLYCQDAGPTQPPRPKRVDTGARNSELERNHAALHQTGTIAQANIAARANTATQTGIPRQPAQSMGQTTVPAEILACAATVRRQYNMPELKPWSGDPVLGDLAGLWDYSHVNLKPPLPVGYKN